MSWREGSSPPTMWRAVRTTLCRALKVASGAVSKPGGDAAGQDALHSAGVEGSEDAGLIPNFLSRLRKKRHWCAFFSTASVWADHVRSSVMWTQRNLKLFTRSTGVLSMGMGECSLLCLLKSTTSSLFLSMLSERWFSWHHLVRVLTSSLLALLSLSVIRPITAVSSANLTMTLELCVAVQSCVQGVQEWAEDVAPRSTSAEDQGRWGVVAHSGHLTSACQEVQDPAAQRSVQSQSLELRNQCGRHYGVKCSTKIHKQHSHIGVLIFQVGECSVQGEGNSILCGRVAAICKL